MSSSSFESLSSGSSSSSSTSSTSSLLPALRRAFPDASSYEILDTIIQPNAVGYKLEVERNNNKTRVFLKQVQAAEYVKTKKDWSDLRRTLLYARTEGRFYREFVPLLAAKGFTLTPLAYYANYQLDGWIDEDERAAQPADPTIDKDQLVIIDDNDENNSSKGGLIILELIDNKTHFQDSPLTLDNCKECLAAVARLHAAAWEDMELLTKAQERLSRASFHLSMRNPKELAGIVDSWDSFRKAFDAQMKTAGLDTDRIQNLGERMAAKAEWVSKQVSPLPGEPYATIIHGDYKSMNAFLPRRRRLPNSDDHDHEDDGSVHQRYEPVLVDFASAGIGLGMSDVAMHIHHAVLPEDLENGGEEELVRHYWETLTAMIDDADYPWELALRHYRLATVDYFRFFLARMWKSATPETMEKKKDNKNINLINRSVPAACAFLRRVDQYLSEIENECAA